MVTTKTQDELDKVAKQRDSENARAEIELIGKSLDRLLANRNQLSQKRDIHKRMVEIQLKKLDVVNPHYEYERDPEYQKLHREHTEISWDMKDRHEYQKYLEQIDNAIKTHEDQLEELQAKIDKEEE